MQGSATSRRMTTRFAAPGAWPRTSNHSQSSRRYIGALKTAICAGKGGETLQEETGYLKGWKAGRVWQLGQLLPKWASSLRTLYRVKPWQTDT